jgi:hypothetical protein
VGYGAVGMILAMVSRGLAGVMSHRPRTPCSTATLSQLPERAGNLKDAEKSSSAQDFRVLTYFA